MHIGDNIRFYIESLDKNCNYLIPTHYLISQRELSSGVPSPDPDLKALKNSLSVHSAGRSALMNIAKELKLSNWEQFKLCVVSFFDPNWELVERIRNIAGKKLLKEIKSAVNEGRSLDTDLMKKCLNASPQKKDLFEAHKLAGQRQDIKDLLIRKDLETTAPGVYKKFFRK